VVGEQQLAGERARAHEFLDALAPGFGSFVTDKIDHPLLLALQEAYREVTGDELKPVGIKVVADGALFAAAGIPTVYHGPVGSGAHADIEFMTVDELVRAAEVYVALLRRLL